MVDPSRHEVHGVAHRLEHIPHLHFAWLRLGDPDQPSDERRVLDGLDEIHRILRMYQDKLASSAGRKSLRPSTMARHFVTQRYSPSDVQEMSALLEDEIRSAGLSVVRAPTRVAAFTHDEVKLAQRLADPRTRDVTEPRIEHDVDCVAGVLTLRRGHRSYRVEDSRAVFATVSGRVILNIRKWWEEDEHETSMPPVVALRALANLAWLKKPSTSPDLQIRELVALCTAAMRPTARLWARFMGHLNELNRTQRLSSDEVTAIIVSSVSDRLLHDAELEHDDAGDVDAGTLDEVVDRVISEYTAEAQQQLVVAEQAHRQNLATAAEDAESRARSAREQARTAVEAMRRRDLSIDGRARRWANWTASALYWVLVALVLVASVAIILRFSFDNSWLGVAIGVAVLVLTLLETGGALGQLRSMRLAVESRLHLRLRAFLSGEAEDRDATDAPIAHEE